eukprot:CAMPEP_0203750746 /NCGR_PEP_ID=MMETSP0098-20131031/4931_1 /ASSEMBLY_ACC=CAM_ASM_000208 /TAXON_ID=96639 /ORGANISM=" , Strain NY0313808BC1" /LENGTH=246 /DNA_ID=CAMNT_0050640173 /DNA_START=935 /DNA_END=1672 /DNA_ORIENTATION=-
MPKIVTLLLGLFGIATSLGEGGLASTCQGPYKDHPFCDDSIRWLLNNWDKVSYSWVYKERGVTGTRCSIQRYLHVYEKNRCPPCECAGGETKPPIKPPSVHSPTETPTKQPTPTGKPAPTGKPTGPGNCACLFPPFPKAFPYCEDSIKWLIANWDTVSYSNVYKERGVDGTRSSIVEYLHRYENRCPNCSECSKGNAPTATPGPAVKPSTTSTSEPTLPPQSSSKLGINLRLDHMKKPLSTTLALG